ncbi:MAG TPA: hypothetical protein VGG61_14755 [Gemmataceae bacterium]
MTKIMIDNSMRTKLNGLDRHVEFCDEAGHTLGHFLPTDLYREFLVSWSKTRASDEELDRRMLEPGACSLAEIWERLGNT